MKWTLILAVVLSVVGFPNEIRRIPFEISRSSLYGSWEGQILEIPGQPPIPRIPLKILLPFRQTLDKAELVWDPNTQWTEKLVLDPIPHPRPSCDWDREVAQSTVLFQRGKVFPEKPMGEPHVVKKHGYQILYVDIYPARYDMETKSLLWLPQGEIVIYLKKDQVRFFRPTPEDEREALALAEDLESLSSYPSASSIKAPVDYLIIGPQEFLTDEHEFSIQRLMWEKSLLGVTAKYETLEQIQKSFSGGDLQSKVREAVRKYYQEAGTRYLLLVGNGFSKTPTKILTVNMDEGSIPSDLFFGCLDGDFKKKPVDMACEVAVGRAPASNVSELHAFVKKSLILDRVSPGNPLIWKTVNFGEKMDESTFASDSLKMLEVGGVAGPGISTVGYPSHTQFFQLYENPQKTYQASEVLSALSQLSFYTLNHLGHCQNDYCLRFSMDSIPQAKTAFPFFGITQGCFPGNLRQTNWASKMVVQSVGGAGALIANSNYGWYSPGGGDGPSNRLHTMFYDSVFREGQRALGKTLYRSKERLIDQAVSNPYMQWVIYETNLLGDPAIHLKFP